MRAEYWITVTSIWLASTAQAQEPKIPESAKQLKGDEITSFLDGKTFDVVVYDAGAPLTATTIWNWKQKKVTGTYDYNGQKGEINNDWKVKGATNCAEK